MSLDNLWVQLGKGEQQQLDMSLSWSLSWICESSVGVISRWVIVEALDVNETTRKQHEEDKGQIFDKGKQMNGN